MKNVIFATIAVIALTLSARAAFASEEATRVMPDQMLEVLTCSPLQLRPDLGMSVSVTKGGIAGLTQVTVQRFFLGHSTTENYIVKMLPKEPMRLGAPDVYVGNGIRLSVNFMTRTNEGKSYGTLQLGNKKNSTLEQLGCEAVIQPNW